jgi:hypothetical protein
LEALPKGGFLKEEMLADAKHWIAIKKSEWSD